MAEAPSVDRERRESGDSGDSGTNGPERALSGAEKRTVAMLGLPTLALALTVTLVTTYLPVVAQGMAGSTIVIGLIVGIEGIIALWLPLVVGTWSDNLRTRIGGRLPFLAAAGPVVLVGLLAMAVVGSVAMLAAAAFIFFLGYFVAYEPYRALYPDAVGDEVAGRAQGTQALWRGAGTGLALLGGGLLISIGRGVPFVAGAVVYLIAMAIFVVVLVRRGIPEQEYEDAGGIREEAASVWQLIREHGELRAYLVANALWELSLAALKTFVVLYVTKGLGFSRVVTSLAIGGVAVVVLFAALASGKLADRYGHLRVFKIALPIYGIGLLVPFVFSSPVIVALSVPFVATGGGVIMALPYAVLMQLMPDEEHGSLTGYYSFSRGLGTWLGPLLGGVAVTGLAGLFTSTHGYQAVWGVCSAAVLLSLLPLRKLRAQTEDR